MKENRHTIAALVENKPGVLARVAGLFSRRGFNIESLSVSQTHDPSLSRMTIDVEGDTLTLEQITKQLHKLIDVIKVSDITSLETVGRELALIKVSADANTRSEIMQIASIFRGQIVDVGEKSLIVEVTGTEDKINAMVRLLKGFGILEFIRTGKVVMVRGLQTT